MYQTTHSMQFVVCQIQIIEKRDSDRDVHQFTIYRFILTHFLIGPRAWDDKIAHSSVGENDKRGFCCDYIH